MGPEVIIFIIWRLFPLLGGYFSLFGGYFLYLEAIFIIWRLFLLCPLFVSFLLCPLFGVSLYHAFVTVLQDLMFVEHLSHDFYDMVSQYLPSPPPPLLPPLPPLLPPLVE